MLKWWPSDRRFPINIARFLPNILTWFWICVILETHITNKRLYIVPKYHNMINIHKSRRVSNQVLFYSFKKGGNTNFMSFVLWFGEFLVASFVKNQLTIKRAIRVVRCRPRYSNLKLICHWYLSVFKISPMKFVKKWIAADAKENQLFHD